ncbi:MAG: M24 family metallopeptidase [Candidatus Fermentithermobacillus carboniphilus]|uniref:M24 family metallopeptidase n=1 Tax=Candidatus Fermentithermobacillus carboniphilus TaxID=3085328 RepID=A0AAT9LDG6_9FIRM|nr:MAG: M24 family metallopeptidase [Candidatus Fermentithermobacillus carboniphilus]
MAELIINPFRIRQETGLDVFRDFLFPKLQLASWKMHGPFIVKTQQGTFAFGRMHERGYFQGMILPGDIKIGYFRPYFLFAPGPERPYPDAVAAIHAACGDEELIVDYETPVALYESIRKTVNTRLPEKFQLVSGTVFKQSTDAVEQLLNSLRPQLTAIAGSLVDTLKTDKKTILKQYLDLSGFGRFEVLDRYLLEHKLAGVIVTSPLNVQEIAGIPQRWNRGGIIALYQTGKREVTVVFTNKLGTMRQGHGVVDVPRFRALLPDGVIGIEEEDMSVGEYLGLGLDSRETVPASAIIRDWREEWAGNDLAAYIIAGLASIRGIEAALDETSRRVREGWPVNEKDVYGFYINRIDEFMDAHGVPLTYEVYFANLHSGNRSESPSCYKDYLVTRHSNSLKFDSGIKLYDESGFLRGVSDVARTACFNREAESLYGLLEKIMLETGIPAAKANATGSDVYKVSCGAVDQKLDFIRTLGLIPLHIEHLSDVFTRDVGHVMGKEEPANLCFAKNDQRRLKPGMIGCFEWQWGYKRHSIGVEDSFVVTTDGPAIFTR